MPSPALDPTRTLDVTTRSGLLVLLGAPPPRGAAWREDDAALLAEVRAERLVVIDAGFPGTFRLRVGAVDPRGAPRATSALRCAGELALAGDEGVLEGEGGLPVPLGPGRFRVEVRTPAADDPDAPDYVLTCAPLAGARAVEPPARLSVLDPAAHPRPRQVPTAVRAGARASLQHALREGRPETRRAALDTYLRTDPRDARALVLRAEVKRDLGELGAALDDAWRATVVAPNDTAAWSALASLLEEAGRGRLAAQAARRADELGDGRGGGRKRSARGAAGRVASR